MAYKFSLETVLRVRKLIEEREERLLQQILQRMANTLQSANETERDIAEWNASRQTAARESSMALDVQASYSKLEQLKLHRKALEDQLEKLRRLREVQIDAYHLAHRNREMLTEMSGQQREVYEADVATREQRDLDDNFIARRRRTL